MLIQKVYDLLVKQGGPGFKNGRCVYFNSENNTKCAIGILLPNPEEFEDVNGNVNAIYCSLPEELQEYDKEYLLDIQSAHDHAAYYFYTRDEIWKETIYYTLKKVAKVWNEELH